MVTSLGQLAVLNPLMLILEQLDLALELPILVPPQVLRARVLLQVASVPQVVSELLVASELQVPMVLAFPVLGRPLARVQATVERRAAQVLHDPHG